MARHCTQCGHELRETDKFCSECGTPMGGAAAPAQYEYCEIECVWVKDGGWFGRDMYQLRAKAVGPNGIYFADSDPPQTDNFLFETEHTRSMLNSFIKRLTADGWEVVPGKTQNSYGEPYWYGFKFRRPVRR